jgi:hypothetical protein
VSGDPRRRGAAGFDGDQFRSCASTYARLPLRWRKTVAPGGWLAAEVSAAVVSARSRARAHLHHREELLHEGDASVAANEALDSEGATKPGTTPAGPDSSNRC